MSAPSRAGELPVDPDLLCEDQPAARPARRRADLLLVGAVAAGGAAGAVVRYAVSLAMPTGAGQFPWATFLINLSGSFLLGLLLVLVMEQFPRGHLARPLIGTGFIGAYTTFSTMSVEAVLLIRDHHLAVATAYLGASLVGGLVCVWLGMLGARLGVRAERWLQRELS